MDQNNICSPAYLNSNQFIREKGLDRQKDTPQSTQKGPPTAESGKA